MLNLFDHIGKDPTTQFWMDSDDTLDFRPFLPEIQFFGQHRHHARNLFLGVHFWVRRHGLEVVSHLPVHPRQ